KHGSINCRLPPERGPCRGNITKYYYHNESRTCRTFSYGGCEGNSNNFRNRHYCMKYCARKRHGWLGTGWI
uniref:Kunitz-type serine protease inhibitor BmKTT-3 n=1 Tax=Olivierus martensii TaxID=34649 RepID=VKT12_OLIMR|nr:RecName: Full=Kunitz-type serine protease inhibitor BmKTT-3; AltName: Full=Delta-KTx 1.2 [Mesobuthus martensii]